MGVIGGGKSCADTPIITHLRDAAGKFVYFIYTFGLLAGIADILGYWHRLHFHRTFLLSCDDDDHIRVVQAETNGMPPFHLTAFATPRVPLS